MTDENNKEVINTTGSVEDVLNLIDRVNETFSYGVWIPSLNKEVMFTVGILTISDKGSKGQRQDKSGDCNCSQLEQFDSFHFSLHY